MSICLYELAFTRNHFLKPYIIYPFSKYVFVLLPFAMTKTMRKEEWRDKRKQDVGYWLCNNWFCTLLLFFGWRFRLLALSWNMYVYEITIYYRLSLQSLSLVVLQYILSLHVTIFISTLSLFQRCAQIGWHYLFIFFFA